MYYHVKNRIWEIGAEAEYVEQDVMRNDSDSVTLID